MKSTSKGIIAELTNTVNEVGQLETRYESEGRTSSSRHDKPSLSKKETGLFEEGDMVYVSLDETKDECERRQSSRRQAKPSSRKKDSDASMEGNISDKDMVYVSLYGSDSSCGNDSDSDYNLLDNLSDSDDDYELSSARGITKGASKPETSKKSSKQDPGDEKKQRKRKIKEKTTEAKKSRKR